MNTYSIGKKAICLALGVYEVWKERGETLAVLVERFRREMSIGGEIPITYAGRLDPMAEGVMILLVGDARFEKDSYLGFDKTYQFMVLFGVATDTYDTLGLIINKQIPCLLPTNREGGQAISKQITKEEIEKTLEAVKQKPLPYPPYSSKPVDGKPLFKYAREGVQPREIPMQKGVPKTIRYIKSEQVRLGDLIQKITSDVQKVTGDFRQAEIAEGWEALSQEQSAAIVELCTFEVVVPSGVYIRSIAHEMGAKVGIPALAYSIIRTLIHKE